MSRGRYLASPLAHWLLTRKGLGTDPQKHMPRDRYPLSCDVPRTGRNTTPVLLAACVSRPLPSNGSTRHNMKDTFKRSNRWQKTAEMNWVNIYIVYHLKLGDVFLPPNIILILRPHCCYEVVGIHYNVDETVHIYHHHSVSACNIQSLRYNTTSGTLVSLICIAGMLPGLL
jgi:hypothetical protein